MNKIKNNIIEIVISIMVLILLFYSSEPVLYSDAQRFLSGSFNNTPLYQIVINVMVSIFKTLSSVVILQTLLIGLSIILFTNTVSIYFNLDILKKLLVSIFLFLPIIEFYDILLTEPICYSFSLFFVSFVIKLIYDLSIRNLIWSGIFVILLLISRNQFLFLYPIILLVYLGIFIIHSSKKTLVFLVISFLSIFIIHNSLMIFNKKINNVKYENNNLINSKRGIFHFIYIDSMYISSKKDAELFKDQETKKLFNEIFTILDDRKAISKYYNGRGHFGLSYAVIRDVTKDKLYYIKDQENNLYMNIKKEISIKIISANLIDYIKLIFKKFYDSTWLFIFIPFFVLLASSLEFFRHKSSLSFVIIFLSSFTLANHSVVYVFGRVQPRYFIYTDFIFLIFIFIIISNFFKKKTN